MSKRSAESKSKLERLKALPWLAILQGALAVDRRWRALSAKERARLTRLARDSHGRPGNLSAKQRGELRGLVKKLDLTGMGRELLGVAHRGRARRGLRRRARM